MGWVVTRHVAVVVNIVENNVIRLLLRKIKVDIGDWKPANGLRKVLYRAVHVNAERGGGSNAIIVGGFVTVNDSAEVGAHNPRCLCGGSCAQQQSEEDQQRDSEVGTTCLQNYADTIPVPYLPVRTYLSQLVQQRQRHNRHDQCIPKFGTGSLG
jgi:hypothetical protein